MFRLVLVLALAAPAYGWGRIVGGKNTLIEDHNYQVSLQFFDSHRCGGSLIGLRVVLTAAHCVHGLENLPQRFSILAGTKYLQNGGERRNVRAIHKNRRYQNANADYDVAVIIVAIPFVLSNKIGIVDLVRKDQHIAVGTVSEVTGWGATREGGYISNILQVVSVPKVNWDTCDSQYVGYGLTERMSCWGYSAGGKDACQGDSGGPLVIYNAAGTPQLAGIVSWGAGCARPKRPGVYAKVEHPEINDFIKQYL